MTTVEAGEIAGADCCYWNEDYLRLDFQTFPAMDEIKRRTQLLISQIATFSEE